VWLRGWNFWWRWSSQLMMKIWQGSSKYSTPFQEP
jgi:hypothetical protein